MNRTKPKKAKAGRQAPRRNRTLIKELRVSYILATNETWEKVEFACSELGWQKTGILKQMIHGYMAVDGLFYARAGIADAAARGMSEEDYFRTLRDKDADSLPKHLNGRPAFGKTPLDDIPDVPSLPDLRRSYNIIRLSAYNLVLLRVAQIVDTGTISQVISRMVVKHLEDKWEKNYLPQIERDRRCKFL